MPETPRNIEALQQNEFASYSSHVVKAIESAKQHHWPITFGPTYSLQSRGGVEVPVTTAAIHYKDPDDAEGMLYKTFLFFARGEEGQIIGHRLTRLEDHPESILARGHIVVKERGKGIASVLESAHVDLLRHEAATRRKEIIYEVDARNTRRLEELKKKIPHDAVADQVDILADKEKENERWHSLYGVGGALEVDAQGNFTITPDLRNRLPDNTDEVMLEREEGMRLALQRGERIEIADKDAWQSIHEHDLNTSILPQLAESS